MNADARRALVFALAPLVAFYFIEDTWGTQVALVISMVVALGELAWQWHRTHKLDRTTLFSAGMVLVLGGVSLVFDDDRFVLYAPVATDALFAGGLFLSVWRGKAVMVMLAEQQHPELANDPIRRRFLRGMTVRLGLNLLLHAALTAAVAGGERSTWLFVSGPVQYILFGVQFLLEIAWGRMTLPPEDEDEEDDNRNESQDGAP